METQEFGRRIRELRRQAGLSQRELADKTGINFTYLSKIESGAMPPPSEKVIVRMAEVLNADRDELIILAGRIPSDIAQLLKKREVLQSLREGRTYPKKKKSTNLGWYKPLSRVAIPLMLVAAIATSLWFAAPTQALDILFPSPPQAGNLGTTHSFTMKIEIADSEILPIDSINMYIYKADDRSSYEATCTNMPLTATAKSYTDAQTGGGAVSVTASVSNWQYGYGYGYAVWESTAYDFGYGYGYGGTGVSSITYAVDWTSPSSWPAGDYKVEAKITANGKTFTKASGAFELSVTSSPGGGGGGGGPEPTPGVTIVTDYVTSGGRFRQEVTAESADSKVVLTIPKDTVGKTKAGGRLSRISILEVADPPDPPDGTVIIGKTYDLDPDGATYVPPITITIYYSDTDLDVGFNEEDLSLAMYNEDTGEWTIIDGFVVDADKNTASAQISHFSYVTILGQPRPAAFTTGSLSISPSKADIDESVNISVIVTNTGSLEGSHSVTLRIDSVVVATKEVTLAGGASETVTFTTSRDAAGSYRVSVNGQTGTLIVETAEPPPPPPDKPATFIITSLAIYPTEVDIGESVTISVEIANYGDLEGTFEATLMIDDAIEATKSVTIAGGASKTITFTTARDAVGTYTIDVHGKSDTFTVREVEEAPAPAKPINWWLIGGIIAGVIAISVIAWLVFIQRRLEGRTIS